MGSITRTDALIQLAQTQGAAPPHEAAHWVSYSDGAAIYLAIVLLVVAGGFAYAGRRLRVPLKVMKPEGAAAGFMIAIWLLAIYTDGIATFVYILQLKEAYPGFVAARVRVGTFVYALVTFFVILYVTRRWGWKVALASALIGTAAAPMLFELPFDLIVMARTNPPIPPRPMLYRQLFFLPAGPQRPRPVHGNVRRRRRFRPRFVLRLDGLAFGHAELGQRQALLGNLRVG